jgi:hypothetical protein
MKKHSLCVLVFLAAISASALAATDQSKPDPLAKVLWLQGHWAGIGEGEPGTSATERHIECALNCRYLRVDGRSVYPKQEKNAKGEIHLAMDMWSFDRKRGKLVLRTFDSLGFTTTYAQDTAASTENTVVMVAEHLENVPAGWQARYTYTFVPPDEYRELFELDPNGKGFQTYVSNRFLRVEK